MPKVKIPLSESHPQLAEEWHPTKNGALRPEDVGRGQKIEVWWQCQAKQHEWKAVITNRVDRQGFRSCPHCPKKLDPLKSIAVTRPDLAAEWHPTKNGDLTPYDVGRGQRRRVWWMCQKQHEWLAQIDSRNEGRGCKKCAHESVDLQDSIAIHFPDFISEWHPENDKSPNEVHHGSQWKIKWQCLENPEHSWIAEVQARTRLKSGCPFCSGRKARPETCLAVLQPELALEWDPHKNGDLTPHDITPHGNKEVWWLCSAKGHSFKKSVNGRFKGRFCPLCFTPHRKRGRFIDDHPDLLKEWDTEKNKDIDLSELSSGSPKSAHWKCKKGHKWIGKISTRTSSTNKACPYCSGLRIENNRAIDVAPYLFNEWDEEANGKPLPQDITIGSELKGIWKCSNGHQWETNVYARARLGTNCPYCFGRYATPETCLANKDPYLSTEWHPTKNGNLTPHDVTSGASRKVHWECSACHHEWEATVTNRSRRGRGCPRCSRQWTLGRFRKWLISLNEDLDDIRWIDWEEKLREEGVSRSNGEARPICEAILRYMLPGSELQRWINNLPSLVDEILAGNEPFVFGLREPIPSHVRREVYKADKYSCQNPYCGSKSDLSVDHILPVVRGGRSDRENLQTLCRSCNSVKHTKTMEEFLEFLNQNAKQPDTVRP